MTGNSTIFHVKSTIFTAVDNRRISHRHVIVMITIFLTPCKVIVFCFSGSLSSQIRDQEQALETLAAKSQKGKYEPRHRKPHVLIFDQVRHKPGCAVTEDG